MVLGQRVRHEHVRADLAAPLDLELHALDVGDLLEVLALLDLGQARAEHVLAVFEVLEVTALDLAGHDDTGRDVRQTHGGRGLVDLLAARAGRAVHVHLDVLVAQLDLAVLGDLGHDLHGGERRVPAAGGVKRADAHEAVDAVFALEEAVGVLAFDHDRRALDAGLVAVEIVHELDGVAVALGPHVVHAVEHARPVLRLGAARAGVEGEDGVVRVILAGQQRLEPHGFERLLEAVKFALEVGQHRVVVLFDGHLAHGQHILPRAGELGVAIELVLERLDALLHALAVFGVVPEAVLRALFLELFDLVARLVEMQRAAQIVQRRAEVVELVFILFKCNGCHTLNPAFFQSNLLIIIKIAALVKQNRAHSASAFGWMDSSLTIQFCTSMISMPSSPMRLTTRVMPELMIMRRHMAHEVVSCSSSPLAASRPTR